ncbi:hypothetical protein [Pollutimonas bauzanensis]|uniref:DUF2909 domain-containing protein n=1 Tax=Pollutimonas bauzanensis TaxID=658167 RepID=A0A1M5ZMH6_9BURK|nr:hypothetical protein [Pollutimonas bauzanensis]SHI25517.1 hypothetical protein SAMN04488135_11650 [Pollutimonas bauzanensis]
MNHLFQCLALVLAAMLACLFMHANPLRQGQGLLLGAIKALRAFALLAIIAIGGLAHGAPFG